MYSEGFQFVLQGQLKTMIALLESDGPGDTGVRFCMASALATLVLDEDVMVLLRTVVKRQCCLSIA